MYGSYLRGKTTSTLEKWVSLLNVRMCFSKSLRESKGYGCGSVVKELLSTRPQSKVVVSGGRLRNCWGHTSNFTHRLVVVPHGEVIFWVLLH